MHQKRVLCFDLHVLLLQIVHLATNHLDLLDMTGNYMHAMISQPVLVYADVGELTLLLIVDVTVGFRLELGADLVQQLIKTLAGGASRRADARGVVVHGDEGWLCAQIQMGRR